MVYFRLAEFRCAENFDYIETIAPLPFMRPNPRFASEAHIAFLLFVYAAQASFIFGVGFMLFDLYEYDGFVFFVIRYDIDFQSPISSKRMHIPLENFQPFIEEIFRGDFFAPFAVLDANILADVPAFPGEEI